MDMITNRAIAARIAITGFVAGAFDRIERNDRGQGSVEYVGIILVVAAIIVILIAAATPIGDAIVSKLQGAVNSIGG